MANKMTLGDLVKVLAARLQDEITIPFKNEKPWHIVFYELKTSDEAEKPKFFESLRFDWDGPYPKSRELSDFLHSLHWNSSISVSNPTFETLTLSPGIKDIWNKYSESFEDSELRFLDLATAKAKQEFSISSNDT